MPAGTTHSSPPTRQGSSKEPDGRQPRDWRVMGEGGRGKSSSVCAACSACVAADPSVPSALPWRGCRNCCKARCLAARPRTRMRQTLNERAFSCARIKAMTSGSGKPNCKAIASKGVSSCQAMAMMPDTSASDKEAAKPECGSVFFTHVVQFTVFLLCRDRCVRSCQSRSNDLHWRCFRGLSSGRSLFDLRRPSPGDRNGWTKAVALSRLSAP